MDRDPLLIGLVALVCGTVAWSLAPMRGSLLTGPAWLRERRAWRAVVTPLLVVAIGGALFVGWALEEPAQSDERLSVLAWTVVVAVLALWVRALVRFVRSAVARPSGPVAVVGLLRPHVVIDPSLEESLDHEALAAALAHEAAHVRHFDPLRIALAQLATDIQWPWPRAKRRLDVWRAVLEEARDDEAVRGGVYPEDLAQAIVGAAKLATVRGGAALTGEAAIVARVSRLLDEPGREQPVRSLWFPALFTVGLVASLSLGIHFGDDIVGLLPGVLR